MCSFKCTISLMISPLDRFSYFKTNRIRVVVNISEKSHRDDISWSQQRFDDLKMRRRRLKISGAVESEFLGAVAPLVGQNSFCWSLPSSRLQFRTALLIKSGCLLFGIKTHRPRTMSGSTKSLDVLLLNLITNEGKPGAIPICVFKTLFSPIQLFWYSSWFGCALWIKK